MQNKCKALLLISSLLSFNCLAVGNVEKAAFVAKGLMNPELLKDINYQQGESFEFGRGKIAHKLFFDAKYQGLMQVIQINCYEIVNTGAIEDCKTVKMTRK
mgnify:CR=1 FL=1